MRILQMTVAILCLMLSPALGAGQKYAVLVGVEQYEHSQLQPLEYSVDDVTELSAVLQKNGYVVTLMTDETGKNQRSLEPTRANIEKQIQTVLDRCRKDDTVILAFAGHGLQFTGQKDAYFCPVDGRPYADKSSSLVSISKIYSELEKSLAGVKVIFVDACRNDPDPGRGRGGLNADAVPPPPRGVAALFSCSAGQRAFEHNTLKHGVFFHYVLEGMKGKAVDREGTITFDGLATYVRRHVPRRVQQLFPQTGVEQSPNLRANLVGVPPVLAHAEASGAMAAPTQPATPIPAFLHDLWKSANRGVASSQYKLAYRYEIGDGVGVNYVEALKWHMKAAAQGNALSPDRIGRMYAQGHGVEKDDKKAVEWYKIGAMLGDKEAQFNLGYRYYIGRGIHQSNTDSFRWMEASAEQGKAEAQTYLGVMYRDGIGTFIDKNAAVKWLRKAVDQGQVNAMTNLGFMYEKGNGVSKNLSEAFQLYQKAAKLGFDAGQANLGYMYLNGFGVPRNRSSAVQWYRRAAAQGNEKAKAVLQQLGE